MYSKNEQEAHKRNGIRYKEEQVEARAVDLPEFLKRTYGFNIIPEYGYYINDEKGLHFRIFMKNGQWITHSAIGIKGDAISTVIAIEQMNGRHIDFKEAIQIILGSQATLPSSFVPKPSNVVVAESKPFKLYHNKISESDKDLIDQYIANRGIDKTTWDAAVAQGFCGALGSYKDIPPCVRFMGSDESGVVRSSDQRFVFPLIKSAVKKSAVKKISKLCQSGSKKEYAPVLSGDPDSKEIHIVEGGFSALGLREILERTSDDAIPTIIMSGGRDSHNFVDTIHISSLIKNAHRVVIWIENEFEKVNTEGGEGKETRLLDPEVQQGTIDAAHRLAIKIKEIAQISVYLEPVPSMYSDTAEWNLNTK